MKRRRGTGGRHVLRASTVHQDSRTQRARARGQDERRAVQGQLQELEEDLDVVEEPTDGEDEE